jgi:hypothetical protein
MSEVKREKQRSDFVYSKSFWKRIQQDDKSFCISDKTKVFIQQLIKKIKQPMEMDNPEMHDVQLKLRSVMNKVTPKKKKEIIEIILSELNHVDGTEKQVNLHLILDICSKNQFYTDMYASIFIKVMCVHTELEVLLDKHIRDTLKETIELVIVNPDDDYDLFCKQNKERDERRAFISFFIAIMANDGYTGNALFINIFTECIHNLRSNINKDALGEFVEYIHIMMETQSEYILQFEDIKKQLVSYIEEEEKVKSLSMRIRFKLLDMKEKIKTIVQSN